MLNNFDLSTPLVMTISNGVKSFSYTVTEIDYEDREVTGRDDTGAEFTFGFGFIEAMGDISPAETKSNDPPKNNDDPINLDDIPF